MGRATFESIGRPLPDRTNIVISRQPQLNNSDSVNFDKGTQLYWTNTLEDALFTADILSICRQSKDIFVIGGQTMYALFNDIVNKIYLTQVFADVPGDAFFRASFPSKQWKLLEEIDHSKNYDGDDYSYRFSIYERRERRFRYAFVSKYFTDKSEKEEWLQLQIKTHRKLITQYIQENLDV
jgi:dihydrofolate reductase